MVGAPLIPLPPPCRGRDRGIDPPQHRAQLPHPHDFAVRLPLPVGEGRGEGFCPKLGVAQLPEPFESGVFDGGFFEVHGGNMLQEGLTLANTC
jgi:hypothetical protein